MTRRRSTTAASVPVPRTVGELVAALRGICGHLSRRDRELVRESVEAIFELSTRLHEATHVAPKRRAGLVQIRREPSEAIAEVVRDVVQDERGWQRQAADDEADGATMSLERIPDETEGTNQ